jgi:hypothetical protein
MKRNVKIEEIRSEVPDVKLEDLSPRELEQLADQLLADWLASSRVRSGIPGPVSSTPMGNGMR